MTNTLENVKATVVDGNITYMVGQSVYGRTHEHGSAAHRDTMFWTNMGPRNQLQQRLDQPTAAPCTSQQLLERHGLADKYNLH
mmetsp:Transcript_38512/g.108858  ORF Transcript_38512/g.108858 Transcript_38512/m.108858 type:complete len:83 (+) Transcript_38512:1882-2130(+)